MDFVDDVHLPQFPSPLACEAAGIDMPTLKNWSMRGRRKNLRAVHIGTEERVRVGGRKELRLNFRRVMQLAITKELVNLGFGPREASLHAFSFTDTESELPQSHRMGELFPTGYTLLIVYSANYSDVVNVQSDHMWRTVLKSGLGMAEPVCAAIVNLNRIDRRVRTTLGLPLSSPREGA